MDAGKLTTSPESAAAVAAEMGYGAVKYFDLKQDPTTSYKFRCVLEFALNTMAFRGRSFSKF